MITPKPNKLTKPVKKVRAVGYTDYYKKNSKSPAERLSGAKISAQAGSDDDETTPEEELKKKALKRRLKLAKETP
jgi:hypothetical protein